MGGTGAPRIFSLAAIHFHRDVHDLFVHRNPLPHAGRRQCRVMGDHAEGARVRASTDSPDVQVRHPRLACASAFFHCLPDLVDDGVIHLPVQEHLGGIRNQALRPEGNNCRPNDAHQRIEPGPAKGPTAGQGHDGEQGGCGVGDDVYVRRDWFASRCIAL